MRPHGTSEVLQARRLQAISLLQSGKTYEFVAATLKASLSSVVRWMQAYRKEGRKGLRPRPVPGRPSRLSWGQKQKLKIQLVQGALKAGYSTELWTQRRIAEVIQRRFRVHYHPRHIWRLMLELGWSWQKPERRALERKEKAIARGKRTIWPSIKKSPKTQGSYRLPR